MITLEQRAQKERDGNLSTLRSDDGGARGGLELPEIMKNQPKGRPLTNAECIEVLRWLKADLRDAAIQAGLR